MVNISRKTYERNCVEKAVHNHGMSWSNEKNIEGGLD